MDFGVQEVHGQQNSERNQEAGHEGNEKKVHALRENRRGGAVRGHDDSGIANVHEACNFILLAFLKKIDVQLFLDLLLSFDGQKLKFLSGSVRNPRHNEAFLRVQLVDLHLKSRNQIVY